VSKRLSEEIKDAVVADYLSGVTTREIRKKHKTCELYSILKQRGIEYKQDNNKQKERYKQVIDLYLKGEKIETIEEITGCKCVYTILKKFNIERVRDPTQYITHKKEERNQQLIQDYFSRKYTIDELSSKYGMSNTNIYRILKLYNIKPDGKSNNHWVIHQKIKNEPNTPGKFYILEDYYGYTKIGITTKSSIKDRFNKKVNVFYEIENTIEYCYNLESNLKKQLKVYIPKTIDKKIDGWTECYALEPQKILPLIKN